MFYRIDAIDSWFFRNAAPFDASINTNGESVFPPFPSVYAGALKNCSVPIQNPNRNKNTFARCLKIGWNGVVIDNDALFPLPLDLYVGEDDEQNIIAKPMVLTPSDGSSFPLPWFLKIADKLKKPPHISGGAYMKAGEMQSYLNGRSSKYTFCSLGDYLNKETRVGIRIDPSTRTAQEGQYYQQTLITPCKITPENVVRRCGLALEAEGIKVQENSIVRVGGEGKLGIVTCFKNSLEIPNPSDYNDRNYFKLYLATPAIFKNGWLPGWIDSENMVGIFKHKKREVTVKLFSAVVGKPIGVGGFGRDINKVLKPREMRYAVPAGSVYYFKLLKGSMDDVIKLFHKKCISDYRETLGFDYDIRDRLKYCSRGFGYSLVGKISDKQKGEFNDV